MGTAADASASEFETHLLSQPSSAEAPAPPPLRRILRAREAHGVRCASLYRGLGADSAERAPLYKDEGIRGETGRPRLSEERFAGSWAAWWTYSVTWPERNWPLAPTVGSPTAGVWSLRLAESFQELFLRLERMEKLLTDLLREVSNPPVEPDMTVLIQQAQQATIEASRRINAEWYAEHLARYHGVKVND